MIATDELRRLLDERGVEYRFNESTKVFEWHFEGTDGEGSAHATEVNGGINIIACSLTPEQAVAATLGAQDLRAENAKLRELVLTLAFCANDEADCDQCPMNDARCDTVQQCFCDGAATALRELGIEVDG